MRMKYDVGLPVALTTAIAVWMTSLSSPLKKKSKHFKKYTFLQIWTVYYLFWHNVLRQVWRVTEIVQAAKGCCRGWTYSGFRPFRSLTSDRDFCSSFDFPEPLIVVQQGVHHDDKGQTFLAFTQY